MKKLLGVILLSAFVVSMVCAVAPVSADTVGEVGEWNFDEGIGSVAYDTANDNDGVLSGGKFGNALLFDAVGDYVMIPDSSSLDSIADLTIELWVKPSVDYGAGPQFYVFASKYQAAGGSSGFQFCYHKGGYLYLYVTSGIAVQSVLLTLTAGNWYHLAATFDNGANTGQIFVNGVDKTQSTSTLTMTQNNVPFCIGARADMSPPYLVKGIMDEVRLSDNIRYTSDFSLALQTSEFETDSNTIGLWHFDESVVGSLAYDSSGNNNDGTIVNAEWSGPTWTTGISGNALHFDGVDDYVQIPDSAVLEPETITVECYVKSSNPGLYSHIISKDFTTAFGASSYALYTGGSGGLYFYVKKSSGYALSANAGTGVWDGEWHHVVGTFGGVYPRLYVDGAEVIGTSSTTDELLYSAAGNLLIGKYSEVQTQPTLDFCYLGDIDGIKIYNYALNTLSLDFDPTSDAVAPVNSLANIRAVVTDDLGNTVEGVTVTLSDYMGLTLSATSGETDADGVFAFTASGATVEIYEVTATISTLAGDVSDTWTLVVYDASAGFVTGGGWIYSSAGAFAADESLEGKATFGFVSKYAKGATVPTGDTSFVFHAAGLEFESTSYQWLVMAGSKATFKGEGAVNDVGGYGFMLTAWDGGKGGDDTFRIKIWEIGSEDLPVYDNGAHTVLGGGSIVVHSK